MTRRAAELKHGPFLECSAVSAVASHQFIGTKTAEEHGAPRCVGSADTNRGAAGRSRTLNVRLLVVIQVWVANCGGSSFRVPRELIVDVVRERTL